ATEVETYFKNYAINANVKVEGNETFIYPLTYPRNYIFSKDKYLYEDFKKELNRLKKHRISSFLK
ncbi:hypothetical protein N9V96_03225, partial [Polaribacter sp.]|nr:hypothetical protein [Polaribacter sp.]